MNWLKLGQGLGQRFHCEMRRGCSSEVGSQPDPSSRVTTRGQTDPGEVISVNLEETSIFSLKDIVKYMSPTLFVIPGGSEIEKLEKSLDFLKANEITSEKTKAVFISSKVPKTILDKKIKFNCVVNFNFYNIHYSIKNLLSWHHNVIHMLENNKTRTLDFGIM